MQVRLLTHSVRIPTICPNFFNYKKGIKYYRHVIHMLLSLYKHGIHVKICKHWANNQKSWKFSKNHQNSLKRTVKNHEKSAKNHQNTLKKQSKIVKILQKSSKFIKNNQESRKFSKNNQLSSTNIKIHQKIAYYRASNFFFHDGYIKILKNINNKAYN